MHPRAYLCRITRSPATEAEAHFDVRTGVWNGRRLRGGERVLRQLRGTEAVIVREHRLHIETRLGVRGNAAVLQHRGFPRVIRRDGTHEVATEVIGEHT